MHTHVGRNHNQRTGKGNIYATRNGTRSLVVGGKKMRALAEEGLKRKGKKPAAKLIKLQCDNRTTITVRSEAAVAMWREKYPNAKIVA